MSFDNTLKPFVPTATRPFDERAGAHLLRRAGFGGSRDEILELIKEGPAAAAERLVNAPPDSALVELDETLDTALSGNDIENLRAWWLLRMVRTAAPFREKLALFLHGHFATAQRKVQSLRAMHAQIKLFLNKGSGSFRSTAKDVARDAAMLIYLDGIKSEKGKPNENFARELMELFILGRGQYSELDIREAARAFTGWRVDGGRARRFTPAFDAGVKTIFNKTGAFGPGEVVDLCIEHPASAPFLAKKILRFFVCPEPPEEIVNAVARELREQDFAIGSVMIKIFQSDFFYSDAAYRVNVKSPVEFTVGTLRILGGRIGGHALARAVAEMGQNLLDPPSVKGWDGHKSWIHAATWLARVQFVFSATQQGGPLARDFEVKKLFDNNSHQDGDVGAALSLLLQNDAPAEVREELLNHYNVKKERNGDAARRDLLRVILTMPEFHCA
ncbi:MAG: DUF1800 family protein [Planctomycetota bacterium]